MLLIAPDKYKGTLSAPEAARIIADVITEPCCLAPMADGGEGTSDVLCSSPEWYSDGLARVNPNTGEAVIDSSAVIGLQGVDLRHHDLLTASSSPLGREVRRLLDYGYKRVTIGIGGTCTCDGGAGFLEALGDYIAYKDRLLGLSDVQVPLLAPPGRPSALMFAPQKGATQQMLPLLAEKLARVEAKYGPARSVFDGAGGGLGYALASVIGAQVVPGAQYVLDSYRIDWSKVRLVITGEGRYDHQTATGKVVHQVCLQAREHGVETVVLAGTVAPGCEEPNVVACDSYLPEQPLTPAVAAERLRLAAGDILTPRC